MDPETVFKALSDGTRHKLLQVLCRQELAVSELTEVVNVPQSTVSRHLRVLREAELVQDRRDGVSSLYSAPTVSQNGKAPQSVRDRVLEWLAGEPLSLVMETRLAQILARRGEAGLGFFDEIGHQWDALRIECFGQQFHLEAMLSLLPEEWTVADIGTGTGYLLPVLSGHFRKVIAVDPVERMLDVARSRVQSLGRSNVDFRAGDSGELPISDEEVDVVLAILVLHHVPTVPESLAELYRVVRPGGRLLVVEQCAHEHRVFHDRMQDRWWGFEPDWLAREIEGAGFENVVSQSLSTARPTGDTISDVPELYSINGRKPLRAE